ncbi:prepilin peptidase [Nocardia sp. NPDC059091]|uniref:prepilin peptidase n=1 Tax=unclassified Nocardia TaxID=2637762 RepID=UPI0036B09CB1
MSPLPVLLLTLWCVALSVCDLRSRRLPNILTLPGAALVLGYGCATGRPALAVSGALLLAVPYLFVHLCCPRALGAGDVKLAFGLGAATALCGAQTWSWAALAAPMLTTAAGLGGMLGHRLPIPGAGGRAVVAGTLAHGPAMCAASMVAVVAVR